MKNTNYIIRPQADFIFAVAGEELGFIGTISIIILLLLIVIECILMAKERTQAESSYAVAWETLIGFQAFINLLRSHGSYAQYRHDSSICQLWTYITCFTVHGNGVLNVGITAEEIFRGEIFIWEVILMNIKLVAHDSRKKLMQNFCIAYRRYLKAKIICTPQAPQDV